MRRLMISCKKAGVLIEKKLAHKLNAREGMELFFHTIVCKACRNYEAQSAFLEKALTGEKNTDKHKPSSDLKEKINKSLEEPK